MPDTLVSRLYRRNSGTPGIIVVGSIPVPGAYLGGRIELAKVSGTGIEFVPNLTGVFSRVLRPYRTLWQGSVGYLPSKHTRYTLVRNLPNIPL